jgi:small subunit ribosomal protein S4e
MSHLKRQSVPKTWTIPRKGKKYVVKPKANGIPLLIALRDMIDVAQNRKEVKRAVHTNNILINGKPAKDETNTLTLFDSITIVPSNKSYRLTIAESGKYSFVEIDSKENNKKVSKIIDKRILKGKKAQLNLEDGNNVLSEIKFNVNDSAILNTTEKKIEKIIPLKEGAKVLIFLGKHIGETGKIKNIVGEMAEVIESSGKDIKVLTKQIIATN